MSRNSGVQEPASFERRALSIKETAKACGLSRATIYRLIAGGKLTTLKVGARRIVPVGSIDTLMNEGSE